MYFIWEGYDTIRNCRESLSQQLVSTSVSELPVRKCLHHQWKYTNPTVTDSWDTLAWPCAPWWWKAALLPPFWNRALAEAAEFLRPPGRPDFSSSSRLHLVSGGWRRLETFKGCRRPRWRFTSFSGRWITVSARPRLPGLQKAMIRVVSIFHGWNERRGGRRGRVAPSSVILLCSAIGPNWSLSWRKPRCFNQ